jgi:hypothetical protein
MEDLRATFLARLRDPRALPILARYAIPVIGVFVLGWSVLETLAAVFLDALSSLWLVAGIAAYFAAQQVDTGEGGIMDTLHFWAGVLGIFLFGAGILTFAVGVLAFMLLPIFQLAHVDPRELVTSGWLPRAFALMVLCQAPAFIHRVHHLEASGLAPERMGMDLETGFVLHRTVMLTATATMLVVFGAYALPLTVIVAQTLGASTEIMRDKYVGLLGTSRQSPPTPMRPAPKTPQLRRWRRRKR